MFIWYRNNWFFPSPCFVSAVLFRSKCASEYLLRSARCSGDDDDDDEKVGEKWWNIFYTFSPHRSLPSISTHREYTGWEFQSLQVVFQLFAENLPKKKLNTPSYSQARGANCCCQRSPPSAHNSKIHNIKREFFKINFRQIVRNSRFKNIWLLKNESKFILDENWWTDGGVRKKRWFFFFLLPTEVELHRVKIEKR